MNKQFENDNFVLYQPDSLNMITEGMEEILNSSLELYKKIFDVNDFRKITINYFDDIKLFREFIYNIRGEKESLPSYAIGTFDKGMINACINVDKNNIVKNKNKVLFMASHELFHIMYKELILKKENMKRITWFDEGMAKFFSGESNYILNDENFIKWVKELRENTNIIPNLNNINHGESFRNDNYNGYDLSLLVVKYMYDTLGIKKFKKSMHDTETIYKYGNMLNDIFDYYLEKNLSK